MKPRTHTWWLLQELGCDHPPVPPSPAIDGRLGNFFCPYIAYLNCDFFFFFFLSTILLGALTLPVLKLLFLQIVTNIAKTTIIGRTVFACPYLPIQFIN